MKKNINLLWMLAVVVSSVLVAACSSSDDYQDPKPATSSMMVNVKLGTGEFDPLQVFDITAHLIDDKGKETVIPITEQDWTKSISAGLPSTMSAYLTFEKKSNLPQGMTTFCYSITADYSFYGQLDNDNKGVENGVESASEEVVAGVNHLRRTIVDEVDVLILRL